MALIDKIIWQIETELTEPIALDGLAVRCGVSPHHMCRLFLHCTGQTVMGYIRARRMALAAKALVSGQDDVLTVALSVGYGSHAAFTRAFASTFGQLPGQLRKARALAGLQLMEPLVMKQTDTIVPGKPEIREIEAFRVVGLGLDCGTGQIGDIPRLWQEFNARSDEVADGRFKATFGVCNPSDEDGQFRYIAGAEASDVPHGMESLRIPAGRYAVFCHEGHVAQLPHFVHAIWSTGLADAGLTPARTPDFERYDSRFNPRTGEGVVEIWIPVEA